LPPACSGSRGHVRSLDAQLAGDAGFGDVVAVLADDGDLGVHAGLAGGTDLGHGIFGSE